MSQGLTLSEKYINITCKTDQYKSFKYFQRYEKINKERKML